MDETLKNYLINAGTFAYAGFLLTVAPYAIYQSIKSIIDSREAIRGSDEDIKYAQEMTKDICKKLTLVKNNLNMSKLNPSVIRINQNKLEKNLQN